MLVIVGTRTDAHSLRSQVGIGSESDCLLGQLERILRISDSETGLKEEKSGAVVGDEGECGDDVLGLQERDRRRLDILPLRARCLHLINCLSSWFGSVLSWFKSYLSSRSFRVKCENNLSSFHTSSCGVPQGCSRPSPLRHVRHYPSQHYNPKCVNIGT